jgi:hypothetical protein
MMERREYCTVEWLWMAKRIRIDQPGGVERTERGSYAEVVATLTDLGQQGWRVATCASGFLWLFWTLERQQ